MITTAFSLALSVWAQQPTPAPKEPDLAVISARLGDCSAEFTVRDEDRQPVYAAVVHVRIRYGFLSLKRMDLEVGTNSEGRARVEGLPAKARPLVYDVSHDDKKATVTQNLETTCRERYDVSLK
jgi:hypothetical protein